MSIANIITPNGIQYDLTCQSLTTKELDVLNLSVSNDLLVGHDVNVGNNATIVNAFTASSANILNNTFSGTIATTALSCSSLVCNGPATINNNTTIAGLVRAAGGYDTTGGSYNTATGVLSSLSGNISTLTGSISTNSGNITTSTGAIGAKVYNYTGIPNQNIFDGNAISIDGGYSIAVSNGSVNISSIEAFTTRVGTYAHFAIFFQWANTASAATTTYTFFMDENVQPHPFTTALQCIGTIEIVGFPTANSGLLLSVPSGGGTSFSGDIIGHVTTNSVYPMVARGMMKTNNF